MDLSLLLNPEQPTTQRPEAVQTRLPAIASTSSQVPRTQSQHTVNYISSSQRPGPTSQDIASRSVPERFAPPVTEIQRSYRRDFKVKVLMWWKHAKLPREGAFDSNLTRSPYGWEVERRYKIPLSTLYEWRKKEASIVNSTRHMRCNRTGVAYCQWPKLEAVLYEAYRERRDACKSVRRGWFYRTAQEAYIACYPEQHLDISKFPFSNSWFHGFLSRHNITLRFATNKSQKVPADYLNPILSWMQFNRRNSLVRSVGGFDDELRVVGRYMLDSICNMDETPLPFEYLDGQTYADKGSRTVQVKASNSGWDKRQATLVLAIFASGRSRVKPVIIFRGKETYTERSRHYLRRRQEEMARYDSRVNIYWNENAYMNSDHLIHWTNNYLIPSMPSGPRLLALDVAKFHYTPAVLANFRTQNILPSLIPAGCTGLVQPLDVAVNKPLKGILRDLMDEALDLYEAQHSQDLREIQSNNTAAITERRVLITWCVGQAWETFCNTRSSVIVDIFRQLGLSLPVDASCDSELTVKGIPSEQLVISDSTPLEEASTTSESSISEPASLVEAGLDFVEGDCFHDTEAVEYIDRD